MSARPILVMAGGTGGHVFPALALAQMLREKAIDVVWLGTQRGLEARVVPAAGIPIEWLSVGGLRGKTRRGRRVAYRSSTRHPRAERYRGFHQPLSLAHRSRSARGVSE
jgi:hypothetical protein